MIKMVIKNPAKTYCQYCKKVLSNSKEKKLQYHKSCYEEFLEFENIHKTIEEQLSLSLGLPENQITEFLENKKITYSLNNNMKISEIKMIDTNLSSIKLSSSFLDELQTLSIINLFSHEEWMDRRDPSWREREGVIYKSDPGLTELPESIGELKNLKVVTLSGNSIKNIPESILELDNLKELTLEANDLEILPEIITRLTNLESLNLSYNPLRTLPDSFVNLINLKKLVFNFECINVRFSLPNNFGDLPKLKELRILSCIGPNLIWSLPDSFAKLNALCILEITGSGYLNARYLGPDPSYPFTFKLPSNFGILPKLEELRIIYCHLEPLPESFANLKSLQILEIADDYKYFSDPKAFDFFPISLKELNLERNNIDLIPPAIINLKNLQLLNIKDNPVAKNMHIRGKRINKPFAEFVSEMKKKNGLIIEK